MSFTISLPKIGVKTRLGRTKGDSRTVGNGASSLSTERKTRRVMPQGVKVAIGVAVGLGVGIGVMKVHAQQIEVLAVINGKLITQDELDRRLENAGGQAMMRQIATQQMQYQFAQQEGSLPSEKWMDAKMAELRKNPNFDQMLDHQGQTEDDYRLNLQIHVAQAALLSRGLKVTDADIHQFYLKNIDPKNAAALFYQPETADIAVIVARDAATAAAAEAALKVGTPFGEVAAKYSIDSSRMSGGSLPTILRGRTNSARIPGLEDYIFSLRVGETTEPRAFAGSTWIIKCLNRTPSKKLAFNDVKEDCEIGAQMAKGMAANGPNVQSAFESFQRTSRVQAFSPRYQDAINAH